MTEQQPMRTEPNGHEILAAIVSVGETFHGLHQYVEDVRTEVAQHRSESRTERARLAAQLDGLRDQIEQERRLADRKFDLLWAELDKLQQTLMPSTELRAFHVEVRTKLQDHDERIAALEQHLKGGTA